MRMPYTYTITSMMTQPGSSLIALTSTNFSGCRLFAKFSEEAIRLESCIVEPMMTCDHSNSIVSLDLGTRILKPDAWNMFLTDAIILRF